MKADAREVPEVRNALIIAGQLCAIVGCFSALTALRSVWSLVGLAIVFGVVMNSVYSVIHEAHHGVLFRNRRVNDACGVLMSLLFPAAFHLLRQGHIGHHVRNRSDDEAFDLYFDAQDRRWKLIVWYGIMTGLYWGLVVISNFALVFAPALLAAPKYRWHRTFEAFLETFHPRYLRWMRLEALAALCLHGGLIAFLGVSFWRYLGMYYGFGLMWSSMQYIHHYNAERDVLRGARNLRIFKFIDMLWLNHNLHRTHHRNPSIPWYHLPAVAAADNDEDAFMLPYYFGMWRGPRQATEHVKNRYAGRIIG